MNSHEGTAERETWFDKAIKNPLEILDWISIGLFLIAVGQLFLARLHPGILLLFLLPPLLAIRFRHARRWSTRFMAHLFLILVGLGELIAPFATKLGHEYKELSPHDSMILEWYVLVYLGYMLVIWPPVLFIRPLVDRYHHQPAEFSIFTCCLGLIAWIIVGPLTVLLLAMLAAGAIPR